MEYWSLASLRRNASAQPAWKEEDGNVKEEKSEGRLDVIKQQVQSQGNQHKEEAADFGYGSALCSKYGFVREVSSAAN